MWIGVSSGVDRTRTAGTGSGASAPAHRIERRALVGGAGVGKWKTGMTNKNKGCSLVLPTGAVMVAIAALTFHPAQARADDLSWLPAQAQVETAMKTQPVVNAAAARLNAAAATQSALEAGSHELNSAAAYNAAT